MRLESRHQSSTSGTFSFTKKSSLRCPGRIRRTAWGLPCTRAPASWTHARAGRLLQPRALKGTGFPEPEPELTAGLASEGHSSLRLPRGKASGSTLRTRRQPDARPRPPTQGPQHVGVAGVEARRQGGRAHGRWKRGARPMPERGARWRRPSPSYLPRSHQTRRACGSGSRPYSAAAPAAAAAATCPAVAMRGARRGVRGAECRVSGKGCGKRGAGRRMRSERPAQAAIASRAVGTKRRAGAGTKSAAPPLPGRPPGCADSSAALPPPGRPPGCARSPAAPAREPGATLSASGPRSGFSPAAAGGRPEAARAEEEGKEGTGGGSTQGARRASSAPRAAWRRGRGGHCRRTQSRRAAWRRGRGPAPPRRTHRS